MRTPSLLLFVVLTALVVGCNKGPKGVVVGGTVTKNGSPVKLDEGEGVTITLTGGDATFTANVGEDGTFSVQQPAGGAIPYSKYKVSYVHYQSPSPYTKKAGFRTEKSLPNEWDVSASNNTFTIALPAK